MVSRALLLASVVGLVSVAAHTSADAALLAAYEFGILGQETTAETSPAYGPTSIWPGTAATAVTDPAGSVGLEISSAASTPASAPYLRLSPAAGSTSAATAVLNNSYFQFSVSAEAGNLLSVSSLDFLVARGGAGIPRGHAVRSSADSFAADLATADVLTVRPNWTTVSIPLAGSGYTNLPSSTPLTFRIYSYSPASGSSVDYDNIAVQGVVPEPASLTLLVLAGAGLMFRRRQA